MNLRTILRTTVACAAVALTADSARAQALAVPSVGTGLSGPVTLDAAAVYWNPGLTAYATEPTLLVGGHLLVGDIGYRRTRRATYQRPDSLDFALPIAPEAVDPEKTGPADPVAANPVGVLPSAFFITPIGKTGLVFGTGVYAPYAAILKFDENGAQRWALTQATIATVNVQPSIAYKFHEALAVGAGVSYVLGFAELARVQDFAALADVGGALGRPPINQRNDFGPNAPPGVRELDVMARPIRIHDAWGHAATFNVGLASQPTPRLKLGLTYFHTTSMTFNGRFSLDMNDDFFTRDLASQGLQYKPVVNGDASLSIPLPRSVVGGASYDFTDVIGANLVVGYTGWSVVDAFDVRVKSPDLAQPRIGLPDTSRILLPRRWKDTVAVEGTLRYRAADRLRTWLTLGYRSAASPDATIDVASPDGDRLVANLGANYALTPKLGLIVEGKLHSILPREVVGSENDLGNGRYRLNLFALGLHAAYAF